MKRFAPVVFALCVGLAHGQELRPDMNATTPDECALFADMAVVAKALRESKVARQSSLAILEAVYAPTDDRHSRIMARLLDEAGAATISAREWARAVGQHCMVHGGKMPWGVRM